MSPTGQRRVGLGVAAGALAGAMWGIVFVVPALVSDFSPWHLAGARYACYGLISLALIAPRWRSIRAHLDRRAWRALWGLSLLGNTLYYVCLSAAVQWGGIAMTTLVIGFLPVLVTLVGSRERGAVPLRRLLPSLLLGGGGLLCVGWTALLSPASHEAAPLLQRALGLTAAIGALLSWSSYAVINSRWLGRVPQLTSTDWNLATGVVTGLQGVLLLLPAIALDPQAHPGEAWQRFALVAISTAFLASVVGNSLWNIASRLLPLTMVGQMILFETLFALLYGFLWEWRGPSLAEAVAIVLMTAGVLSCASVHRPPAPKAEGPHAG